MRFFLYVIVIFFNFFSSYSYAIDLESLGLDDVRSKISNVKNKETEKDNSNKNKPLPKKLLIREKKDKNKGDNNVLQNPKNYNINILKDKSNLVKAEGFLRNKSKNIKDNLIGVKEKISNILSPTSSDVVNIKLNTTNIIGSKELKIKDKSVKKINSNKKYKFNKLYPKPVTKIAPDFLTTDIAPPLLSRRFSDENIHHPILPRYSDKVDILFAEIGTNDINDFNAIIREIFNVNIYNEFGDTPLLFAVSLKRRLIVASLLAAGANPDLKNSLGLTSINIAIKMGDYEMVKLLVESGANLDIRNNFGETYLIQAVRIGYLPIIDYLLSKDINLNAVNKQNLTALDTARMSNNNVVIQLLTKYGAKKRVIVERSIINELEGKW